MEELKQLELQKTKLYLKAIKCVPLSKKQNEYMAKINEIWEKINQLNKTNS